MPRHLPRQLRRLLAGPALGALMAAPGVALAQASEDWDSDGEQGVSQSEWESGLERSGIYDRIDADGSGALSEDELNAGISDAFEFEPVTEGDFDEGSAYRRWDADGDGRLSDDEFSTGSYQSFDSNTDGRLDDNEFPRPRTLGSGRDYPGLQGERGGGGVGRDPGIGTGGLEGTSGPGGAGGSGIGGNGAGDM